MALTLHGTVSDNTAVLDRPSAKPLIINGNMAVAQRSGAAVTGLGDGDEGYVTVDRFRHTVAGGTAGRFTSTQEAVNDIPGFHESLNINCTTADTSLAANEFFAIDYRIEGHDLHHFNKGHSTAKPFTLAFYAKANAAHTFGIQFRDLDNNRHCTARYTTTTGWTRHVINIPADTTGLFDNDANESLRIRFMLHHGSTYTGGTAPTTWEAHDNANAYDSGNGSIFSSTNNFISITGVQLEVGEYDINSIPPFQYESFGDNLRRCQRYCQVYGAYGNTMLGFGHTGSQTQVFRWGFSLGVEMRANPTSAVSGTVAFWNGQLGANAVLGTTYNKPDLVDIDCTCDTGGLVDDVGRLTKLFMNTGTFTLTAEL